MTREAHGRALVWRAGMPEAEVVAGLLVEFRDHFGRTWPSENAFIAGVERLMGQTDAEYLLAAPDADSAPAAVCQLRYRFGIWYAAEDAWLEDLYVRESARRHGLGAALVDAALARARERGCRRIELDVNAANAAGRALYERFGFSAGSTEQDGENLLMRKGLEERG